MRQFLFSVLLLGSASVVQAINDFETVFKVYKKGVDEEVKWKDFSGTDMKSMTLVATKPGSNVRIPLPLSDCAESGKSSATCTRWINNGKYKFENGDKLPILTGSVYFFELEYIEKSPSTKTGTSKSTAFVVEDGPSSSKSSSSSSKSGSGGGKKGKGKLSKGAIIGIAVAAGVCLLYSLFYFVKLWYIKRNKGTTSGGVDDHEMGKQEAPLMGQSGTATHTPPVWSTDNPADVRPHESELPKYDSYKPTSGQGAAAEYYAGPGATQNNGAGSMGHDRY